MLLFLFGVVVTAWPVIGRPHLPTQDGGGHYNTAMVLAGLSSEARGFFGQYFEPRATPPSNQFVSQFMAWLAGRGLAAAAERIAWALIFVAFAGVVVINLRKLRAVGFALLLFPLFAGVLVNLGFMNYLVGLLLFVQGAFLLQAGLRRASAWWVVGLVAVSLATYAAHPLAGMALAATCGSFGAGALALRRSLVVPVGCALACAVLAAWLTYDDWPQIVRFVTTTADGVAGVAPTPASFPVPDTLRERLISVVGLSYFVSHSPADYVFSAGFALVLVWLACRRRAWRPADIWLGPAATLLVLTLIVPRRFEYYLPERLMPCLLAVVVIWLAATVSERSALRVVVAAGLVLNAGLLLWRLQWEAHIETVLREYASVAPMIPDGASLLTIGTSTSEQQLNCRALRPRVLPCGFRPTLHFMGEVVGDRPVALLTNYQLQPETGYFPIALRAPWRDYTGRIGSLERWPPLPPDAPAVTADVAGLIARLPPDVIVTWDDRLATGGAPGMAAEELLGGYTQVFTSTPLGAARVYRRNSAGR